MTDGPDSATKTPTPAWWNRIPIWIWLAAIVALAFGAIAFTNRDSDDTDNMTPSEAYCSDLRNGYTVMNLWDRDVDPEKYAGQAFGRMSISCPEQLEKYRAYFEGWNINIDA